MRKEHGTALQELLRARGMSVADLTRASGLRYSRVWLAVAGLEVSAETRAKLAEALHVEPELLAGQGSAT